MYIATFYSFKGGVGRSMALVNAGIELAKKDRRVLLVDFDLEAPGLDTFKALKFKKMGLGVVDFVSNYITQGTPDDVDEYVTECQLDNIDGSIWLMPAGGSKRGFANLTHSIDWKDLYANKQGYLLMEDLKAQWQDKLQFDYVLIDSPTGHTDFGGICTRQLPDAVAIFYFPNEQNLRGVRMIAEEIKSEEHSRRKKTIQLHFIMSNIPDLDDGHQILEKEINKFKKQLKLREDPLKVHRYDSLSLLNQEIFTLSRPQSRLANEYRNIVAQIVHGNLEDKSGALSYLYSLERPRWSTRSGPRDFAEQNRESSLEKIENYHSDDPEVLYRLGRRYHRDQELARADTLYQRAIDLGNNKPEVYLDRARALSELQNAEAASEVAFQILELNEPPQRLIVRAIKLIRPEEFPNVENSKAVRSLDNEARVGLISELFFTVTDSMINLARHLIQPIIAAEITSLSSEPLQHNLGLLYIAFNQFKLAQKLFSKPYRDLPIIFGAFNLAMASWGENGAYNTGDFEKVVFLHEADEQSENRLDNADYTQCLALSYWASGDADKALEFVEKSRRVLGPYRPTFSCWRYRMVNRREFLQDLNDLKLLVEGDRAKVPVVLNVFGRLPTFER